MTTPRPARALKIRAIEMLDDRIVPSGMSLNPAKVAAQDSLITSKGSAALGTIYQDFAKFERSGGHGAFKSSESGSVSIKGTTVGVDIAVTGARFKAFEGQLQKLGLKVTAASATNGTIAGYLPISQLPTVAGNAHDAQLTPIYKAGYQPPAITVPSFTIPTTTPTVPVSAATPIPVTNPTTTTTITLPTAPVVTAPVVTTTPVTTTTPTVTNAVATTTTETPITAAEPTSGGSTIVADKGGTLLGDLYHEFVDYSSSGSTAPFAPTQSSSIYISGTSVELDVRVSGDLATSVGYLQALGMQVTATSATAGVIEGFMPIAQLPATAEVATVIGFSPVYKPDIH